MNEPEPQEDGQEMASKPELGQLGKIIATVVALAILTPFIVILWAWAGVVVRSLGGIW